MRYFRKIDAYALFIAWKFRELQRLKRDREAREAEEAEQVKGFIFLLERFGFY